MGHRALVASTAVPFPFPTSIFFAAAGASNYHMGKYPAIVTICRAARYATIAIAADLYGRHFILILRHPTQYWGWLLLFAKLIFGLITAGIHFWFRCEVLVLPVLHVPSINERLEIGTILN